MVKAMERFIQGMRDTMYCRLMDNVQGGMTTAEGQFTLGDHEICVSIDPTGADVEIYGEGGLRRGLPRLTEAMERAMPTYGDALRGVELEEEAARDEEALHESLCLSYGWSW